MARFDKKWWFVHVPAGVAVVALMAFGVNQCEGQKDEAAEKLKAQQQLVDAGEKMEIAAARMDSLLNVNNHLGADNMRKSDTIRVLKDSVNTLNGQIVELKQDNDSLTVALSDCRNASRRQRSSRRASRPENVAPDSKPAAPSEKPCVRNSQVPCRPVNSRCDTVANVNTANVTLDASYNNGNVIVDNGAANTDICLGNGAVNNGNIVIGDANAIAAGAERANVEMISGYNNGNVIVENAPRNANVSLGGNAVNNGAIVVGNANTVYHVTPDTIVRVTTTKSNIVRCRVITKQRQYR